MTINYVYNDSSGMFLVGTDLASITALGWQGTLLRNSAALPLEQISGLLCSLLPCVPGQSCPQPLDLLLRQLLPAPSVSNTRGTKARPAFLQASPCLVCLFVCLGCWLASAPLLIPPSAYPPTERPMGTSLKGKQGQCVVIFTF